jgi:hypothetical protein
MLVAGCLGAWSLFLAPVERPQGHVGHLDYLEAHTCKQNEYLIQDNSNFALSAVSTTFYSTDNILFYFILTRETA